MYWSGLQELSSSTIEILLVEPENREAPGNVLIVSERDARQSRFARSDHIPSGSDEVDHVAQRRQADDAVRIVRQQRLAAGR